MERIRRRRRVCAVCLAGDRLRAGAAGARATRRGWPFPGAPRAASFIVAARRQSTSPAQVEIAPGRRFRLSGPKDVLNDIKKREGRMIEVTGLVRKAALKGPGGIAIAGGRVRIGAGLPQSPTGDPRARRDRLRTGRARRRRVEAAGRELFGEVARTPGSGLPGFGDPYPDEPLFLTAGAGSGWRRRRCSATGGAAWPADRPSGTRPASCSSPSAWCRRSSRPCTCRAPCRWRAAPCRTPDTSSSRRRARLRAAGCTASGTPSRYGLAPGR